MYKILDRYLIREFFKPFFLSLAIFTLVLLVAELFETLGVFIDKKAPLDQIASYLFYHTPFWIGKIIPLACLLGVLFSLNFFSRYNELTAVKSVGINLTRFFLSLYLTGIFLSLFCFIFNEIIVPPASQKAENIYQFKIKKREVSLIHNQIIFYGEGNTIYNIEHLNLKNKTMEGINIDRFGNNYLLKEQVSSLTAHWEPGKLILEETKIRQFNENGELSREENLPQKIIKINNRPEDFIPRTYTNDSQISFKQMNKYIDQAQKSGKTTLKEKVDLQMKISFPLSCLILTLIGIPFGLLYPRSGRMFGFGLAVMLAFLYWGIMEIGHALGQNGKVSPFISAWLGNIFFIGVGFILLNKIKR